MRLFCKAVIKESINNNLRYLWVRQRTNHFRQSKWFFCSKSRNENKYVYMNIKFRLTAVLPLQTNQFEVAQRNLAEPLQTIKKLKRRCQYVLC